MHAWLNFKIKSILFTEYVTINNRQDAITFFHAKKVHDSYEIYLSLNIFYGFGFSSVSLGEQMMLNLSSSMTQVQKSQDCLDLHKKSH